MSVYYNCKRSYIFADFICICKCHNNVDDTNNSNNNNNDDNNDNDNNDESNDF